MAARALDWSSTPHDLLPSIIGRQPVAFAVRGRGLLRSWRPQVRVALVPLEDIRDGRLLGDAVNDWLVWQSVTGTGTITRLPGDVEVLARSLRVPDRGDGALLRAALRQVFDALYEERRL